jgi:NAD(P)-dependent dehydrogenase (short-subunit alcohol dehydrogenase family)
MLGFVTGASSGVGEAFAVRLAAAPFPVMRAGEVVSAALAGLRLGEVICIPGLNDPSMTGAVGQAQQALLLTAVSSPLADRYRGE